MKHKRYVVKFESMKKPAQMDRSFHGRRTESLNEPILHSLHALLLGYSSIRDRLEKLHVLADDFAYSDKASKMQFLL